MDFSTNLFQLFEQESSKDHLFIDVPCGHLIFALDFNILIEYSELVKSIFQESKSLSKEKKIQSISTKFNKKFQEICESLKTKQVNIQLFLCILTGKRQTLHNSDLFDFYNLSKYLKIPKLLEHIQNFCESLKTPNEILSVLANRKIMEEEEENFNEFLNCGHMKEKLCSNIRKLLQIKNFRNFFPLSSIFILFKCSEKNGFYTNETNNNGNSDLINQLKKENESLKQKIKEIQAEKDEIIQNLKEENEKLKKIIAKSSEKQNLSKSASSSSSSSSSFNQNNSENANKTNSDKKQDEIDIELDFEEKNSNINNENESVKSDNESNKSDSDDNKTLSNSSKSDDNDKNENNSDDNFDSNDEKSKTDSDDNKNNSDNKNQSNSGDDFNNFDDDFVDD